MSLCGVDVDTLNSEPTMSAEDPSIQCSLRSIWCDHAKPFMGPRLFRHIATADMEDRSETACTECLNAIQRPDVRDEFPPEMVESHFTAIFINLGFIKRASSRCLAISEPPCVLLGRKLVRTLSHPWPAFSSPWRSSERATNPDAYNTGLHLCLLSTPCEID